jgi:hypothetical protein
VTEKDTVLFAETDGVYELVEEVVEEAVFDELVVDDWLAVAVMVGERPPVTVDEAVTERMAEFDGVVVVVDVEVTVGEDVVEALMGVGRSMDAVDDADGDDVEDAALLMTVAVAVFDAADADGIVDTEAVVDAVAEFDGEPDALTDADAFTDDDTAMVALTLAVVVVDPETEDVVVAVAVAVAEAVAVAVAVAVALAVAVDDDVPDVV